MADLHGITARLSRLLRTAAAVGALVALAGCVSIPTSGSVRPAGPINDDDAPPSALLLPEGPQGGADQVTILQGFIRAGVGPENNYAVARQFLTAELAERWNPNSGVTIIQAGSESFAQTSETTLEFGVVPSATVDAFGRFWQQSGGGTEVLRFEFTQVSGQWRISSAPDGIVLTGSSFDQVFDPHALYYFDPTLSYLVPDLRFFPSPSLGVRIVNALLAGPSDWLRPGVVTRFPEGTRLGAGSVQVEGGRAVVDLSTEAAEADVESRERMRLQLEQSLSSVSTISSVSLSIEQAAVPVDQLAAPPIAEPEVDPRALIGRDGVFGYFQRGDDLERLGRLSEALERLGADSVTVHEAERQAAVRAGGLVYAVSGGEATLVDDRPGLADPTMDSLGYVWSVPTREPGALRAFAPDGTPVTVAAPPTQEGTVRSIEVSRDGTRIAMLLDDDPRPRLLVAAIVREEGVPVALGPPIELPLGAADPVDATWADSQSIASVSVSGAEYVVSLHTVGATVSSLGSVPMATAIVGGNGPDGLRVLGSTGVVYQPRGTGWQPTSATADVLVTQR